MYPVALSLFNFGVHAETEFSFNDFSSALILGKIKDNEKFSNGSGKSTIVNAIEYVIYNEVKFSALDKTIRDGCEFCRVSFDFVSSIDKALYRIVRSNSRKSGTDVRLFRQENDIWTDKSQRRVSDTEKEIAKIIGFNYKTFCAAVLFCQSGSENNTQKDFGNLPFLTAEKRKSVLREVLQLNIYNSYEKLARAKHSALLTELEKNRVLLGILGNPLSDKKELLKKKESFQQILVNKQKELDILQGDMWGVKTAVETHKNYYQTHASRVEITEAQARSCREVIGKYRSSIKDVQTKLGKLPEELQSLKEKISTLQGQLIIASQNHNPIDELKREATEISETGLQTRSELTAMQGKLQSKNNTLPSEINCSKCFQNIPEHHRHNWENQRQEEISNLKLEITALNHKLSKQVAKYTLVAEKIKSQELLDKKITSINNSIYLFSKELESKTGLTAQYQSLLLEQSKILQDKENELKIIEEKSRDFASINIQSLKEELSKTELRLKELSSQSECLITEIAQLVGELAVLLHRIAQCDVDEVRVSQTLIRISELEKSITVHTKVVQAFGSNGIPSLITHSILDELQGETNMWLAKLRPGLQLQFIVINDKHEKEKEDTLDIQYFIDGAQREYRQLSGAQKIIVSLAIKLGLLHIMNKRLGVDIKLLLLDEVDQALDEGSAEVFAQIIKIIESDFKVLVITHNDALKNNFSHAIVVDQDENNVSRAKLTHW